MTGMAARPIARGTQDRIQPAWRNPQPVICVTESTPRYDGVAELTFADYTAFEKYWSSARVQDIFASDAPRFLDAANCTAFVADETRVLWP